MQNIGVGAKGGNVFAGGKLTLKTDDIAKLIIELKSMLLEITSNKIKGTYIK